MSYSDFYIQKNNKIPTGVALVIVIIVMVILSRFFLTTPISTRASPIITNSIKITNLTSNQGIVIFESASEQSAWILYGTNPEKLDNIAADVRDIEEKKIRYRLHYIPIKKLTPQTKYYYKIVADDKIYAQADGTPFIFETLPSVTQSLNIRPAYGKIITKSGDLAVNTIIILSTDTTQPLSAITKSGGDFVIPLSQIFERQTNKLHSISNKEIIVLEVKNESKEKTRISATLSNISPLPEVVTLGKDYNFTAIESVLSASSKVSDSTPLPANQIGIIFPKENALIPDIVPLIKGRAFPQSEVKLTVQKGSSKTFSQTVKAQSDGSWKLLLPNKLSPGSYSLSFIGKDANGKALSQTRSFSIIKSGESVLGEATPAANPTSIISPTILPTLIPSPTGTTPAILPSSTPKPVASSPTASIAPPPEAGNNTPQAIISSLALIFGGIGLLLFAF